jgi:hypothetical protein
MVTLWRITVSWCSEAGCATAMAPAAAVIRGRLTLHNVAKQYHNQTQYFVISEAC